MGNQQVMALFKDIPSLEKPYYKVDENGNVLSVRRGRFLTSKLNPFGYPEVHLSFDGKDKTMRVHRLVALAFIPNPDGKPQINHKDGNKTNNHISNLEWATASENVQHSFDTELNIPRRGEQVTGAVLTDCEVVDICNMMQSGFSNKEIMKKYPLNFKTLSNIRTGTRWKHVTLNYDIPCKRQPRLLKQDVINICKLFSEGYSVSEIVGMKAFSYVTEASICNIFKRKFHTGISSEYEW